MSNQKPISHIRAAQPEDSEVCAKLIYQVAPEKFDYCFGCNGDNPIDVLQDLFINDIGIFGYSYSTVIEVDGNIVGNGVFYTEQQINYANKKLLSWGFSYWIKTNKPMWIAYLNFVKVLYRALKISLIQAKTPKNTLYIGSISVIPSKRSQGFAKTLLLTKEREAFSEGMNMGLDVALSNKGAIRLYEYMGYQKEWEKHFNKRLNKFPDYCRMVKFCKS